ncbi:MAG TPA: GNAT family N-acetyltransferase [Rugosimonospora sp.]
MAAIDVSLRPLTRDDLPRVARWLAEPHVAAWWHDPSDLAAVQARYLPCITGADPTEVFVMVVEGRAVGLIQRYMISDDPDWSRAMAAAGVRADRSAGIDYLIGDPELIGRGVGSTAIGTFTGLTFLRYPRADAVSVAVQQANRASWRALERAGFVRLWAGQLDSDDPSDAGPAYVYARNRAATA